MDGNKTRVLQLTNSAANDEHIEWEKMSLQNENES